MISPSSSQDDTVGDDESSSSIPTPVSFSSGASDSPVFYRQCNTTIDVNVFDAQNNIVSPNVLRPPTILLEAPGIINKCLSPIRELPTPMPSPAITPILPSQRLVKSPCMHEETLAVTYTKDVIMYNN